MMWLRRARCTASHFVLLGSESMPKGGFEVGFGFLAPPTFFTLLVKARTTCWYFVLGRPRDVTIKPSLMRCSNSSASRRTYFNG